MSEAMGLLITLLIGLTWGFLLGLIFNRKGDL